MSSIKSKRIASNIQKEITSIILEEARDNILQSITITGCVLSNDLSIAKVYFTSMLDMDKIQLEKEMREASPFIRKELASRIEIRHTPEIRFVFDESIEYGSNIDRIINEIHNK